MRQRNMKAAKRLGTKALAGVLAIGLIVSTPAAVLADGETETAGTQSTASQTPVIQAEKLQAKISRWQGYTYRCVRYSERDDPKR